MTPPRRVFILDDHTVVRAGVRLLLDDEPDLVVVGEAPNIAELMAKPVAYDVVVADLILPDASGEEVVGAIRAHAPGANVLILSMVDDVNAAESLQLQMLLLILIQRRIVLDDVVVGGKEEAAGAARRIADPHSGFGSHHLDNGAN